MSKLRFGNGRPVRPVETLPDVWELDLYDYSGMLRADDVRRLLKLPRVQAKGAEG